MATDRKKSKPMYSATDEYARTKNTEQDARLDTLPEPNADGLPYGTDLDTVVTPMVVNVYQSDDIVNLPFTESGSAGLLEVLKVERSSNTRVLQRYYKTNVGSYYWRVMDDLGVWTQWVRPVYVQETTDFIDLSGRDVFMDYPNEVLNIANSSRPMFRMQCRNSSTRGVSELYFYKGSGGREYKKLFRIGTESGNADGRAFVALLGGVDIGTKGHWKEEVSIVVRAGTHSVSNVNWSGNSTGINDIDRTEILVCSVPGTNFFDVWVGVCDYGAGMLRVDGMQGIDTFYMLDGHYASDSNLSTTRPSNIVYSNL